MSTATTPAVKIRWMVRRDIPQVLRVDQGGMSERWTGKRILWVLRRRNVIGMVAEDASGRIVGWLLYSIAGEYGRGWVRLHTLAVHQSRRRRGLGGQLLAKVVGKQETHRRPVLVWTVPEGNLAAQLLARSEGMTCERIIPDRFDGGES